MALATRVCRVGFARLSPVFVLAEHRELGAVTGLATNVWR
jgi:hypothetical protein